MTASSSISQITTHTSHKTPRVSNVRHRTLGGHFNSPIFLHTHVMAQTPGQFIVENRKALNLTQEDVASNCHTSKLTISKVETDKSDSRFKLMVKIFNYLTSKGAPKFDLYDSASNA